MVVTDEAFVKVEKFRRLPGSIEAQIRYGWGRTV